MTDMPREMPVRKCLAADMDPAQRDARTGMCPFNSNRDIP